MNGHTDGPPPADFAETTRLTFKAKADHNKRESLFCFGAVIVCTLSAPLFVTLGQSTFWGKVVPSVLSLMAAGLTAWIQLRKPQQLWALYRSCQRQIEDALYAYRYNFGRFATTGDSDVLLAERVAEIAMFAHTEWVSLVPNPERLGQAIEPNPPRTDER